MSGIKNETIELGNNGRLMDRLIRVALGVGLLLLIAVFIFAASQMPRVQ